MKRDFKYVLIAILFAFSGKAHSQLCFSVDTLKIGDVLWICQNDVWIEDFAYGPRFDMLFSIKNNGKDTVLIHTNTANLYLEYGDAHTKKKNISNFQEGNTTIIILPDSTYRFWGQVYFYDMEGEMTTGLNYRFVNFLPEIDMIVENAEIVLEIYGSKSTKTSFQNCFTENHFFHDGTYHESIYYSGHR